jgi:hypothetical protein
MTKTPEGQKGQPDTVRVQTHIESPTYLYGPKFVELPTDQHAAVQKILSLPERVEDGENRIHNPRFGAYSEAVERGIIPPKPVIRGIDWRQKDFKQSWTCPDCQKRLSDESGSCDCQGHWQIFHGNTRAPERTISWSDHLNNLLKENQEPRESGQ